MVQPRKHMCSCAGLFFSSPDYSDFVWGADPATYQAKKRKAGGGGERGQAGEIKAGGRAGSHEGGSKAAAATGGYAKLLLIYY